MLCVAVEFIFGILFTFFCEVPWAGRMEEGLSDVGAVEEEAVVEDVDEEAGFCAGAGVAVAVCAAGCGFGAPLLFCGSCAKAAEKKNRAKTAVRQVVFMFGSLLR